MYRVLLTRRSTIIISREKEAEGPARRANRLDTGIRSPEVEGEADYTRKSGDSGRGPEANAQSISRTRLGAIASVGGLRTVAGTDRPTNRFLLGINSFNTPAAAAVNTLSQVNFKRKVLDLGLHYVCRAPAVARSRGSHARL